MLSIESCKGILGEEMPDLEVLELREALYTLVESVMDNYFQEFDTIELCKKQLYIAESPQLSKVLKDTD